MATNTEIVNYALAKIGGAGEQINGSGFIDSIDDEDKVSQQASLMLGFVRPRVITEAATSGYPFRETVKYADLEAELSEASLPSIPGYEYAFNLPADCLAVVRQMDYTDNETVEEKDKTIYPFLVVPNLTNDGKIFLTNHLTNEDEDSAYVEYCIDQTNTGLYTTALIESIATLLAAELCPLMGKDLKIRQAMLNEYYQLTARRSGAMSQSQYKKYTPSTENFNGDRT